jgi:hypothetical protein
VAKRTGLIEEAQQGDDLSQFTDPEALSEAAKAARAAALETLRASGGEPDEPGTLRLSSGIVLRIKAVPQRALRDAARRVPVPPVPVFHNEDKDRDEENPNDPDYQRAMQEYQIATYSAGANIAMLMGTEFKSAPPGEYGPDDDEWVSFLRMTSSGLLDEIDLNDKAQRYFAWLNYWALRTNDDTSLCVMAPMLAASVSEEEVALAVSSFRSDKRRQTDRDSAPEAPGRNGHQVVEQVGAVGDRQRVRRTRRSNGSSNTVDGVRDAAED